MALVIECDGGCGATTDKLSKFKEFGLVRKVYYCKDCRKAMQDLLQARDDKHTEHAQNLENDLLTEIATFQTALPNGKLPDVIE